MSQTIFHRPAGRERGDREPPAHAQEVPRCGAASSALKSACVQDASGTVPLGAAQNRLAGGFGELSREILVMWCTSPARPLYRPDFEGLSRKMPGLLQNQDETPRQPGDRAVAHSGLLSTLDPRLTKLSGRRQLGRRDNRSRGTAVGCRRQGARPSRTGGGAARLAGLDTPRR